MDWGGILGGFGGLLAVWVAWRTQRDKSRADAKERERADRAAKQKAELEAEREQKSELQRSLDRARVVDDSVVDRLQEQITRQDADLHRLSVQAREREAYHVEEQQRHRDEIEALNRRAEQAEHRAKEADRRAAAAEQRATLAERAVLNLQRRLDVLEARGGAA